METIKQGKVKYSKPMSLLGMIAGIGFVIFGITLFGSEVLSSSNTPSFVILFFILWIGIAVGITVLHGANVFSKKGISFVDVDLKSDGQENRGANSFEEKLRKLNALRKDNLIDEDEFKKKRQEIMQQKW